MKKHNLLVDFTTQGYNVRGNILYIFYRILVELKSGATFTITTPYNKL